MVSLLNGRCLCGAVHYAVEDRFEYAMNCHCSQCRQATGSAFKPMGGIGRAYLKIIAGEADIVVWGEAPDVDVRCGRCGSLLYSVVRDGDYVHVTYGTLQDTPSLLPQSHIFVGSKAPWHQITDNLPQFDTFPSAREA